MIWPVNYQSPLLLDGWLEFNRYKWGVEPLRLRLSEEGKELPAIEMVVYLDKKGRIVQPPLNPYLPMVFHPTPTDKVTNLYKQWQRVAKLLVDEFARRGVKGTIAFPPEVVDIRQWQWNGFLAEVRYTFYLNLCEYDFDLVDSSKRRNINKAKRADFTCQIASEDDLADVASCLAETEERKRFKYGLSAKDLQAGISLLGKEVFRVYVCLFKTEVVSAEVIISLPGMRAIAWLAGTKTNFLKSGSPQLLKDFVLRDLLQQGIKDFDFVGANLPGVSLGKAEWGGTLTPYYAIRSFNLRTVASLGYRIFKHWIGRK